MPRRLFSPLPQVPHLNGDELVDLCWTPYSLLGFGDILVPGLLLSYCAGYDRVKGTPCKCYWLTSNIGEFKDVKKWCVTS